MDDSPTARLLYGVDVREGLKLLPDSSVHVVCPSPPYWGLRDYGVEGQIGLEESPDDYVNNLVEVFREVRRVLRPDGTLWLNLGDSYVNHPSSAVNRNGITGSLNGGKSEFVCRTETRGSQQRKVIPAGLKPKDLVGIPWRIALALQADGWYLRSDIIWHKPNPMPEAVTDRCTRSHEYVFMFAHPDSGGRYFYDNEAVREPSAQPDRVREDTFGGVSWKERHQHSEGGLFTGSTSRNKRTVWSINPRPYKGAHFATWPPELVETMIKAGSSQYGVCSKCSAPWQHEVERDSVRDMAEEREMPKTPLNVVRAGWRNAPAPMIQRDEWVPTCSCAGNTPVNATVLDPFSGSATTGYVALRLGRNYVGLDLNPEYLPMAETRVVGDAPPAKDVGAVAEGSALDIFGSDS